MTLTVLWLLSDLERWRWTALDKFVQWKVWLFNIGLAISFSISRAPVGAKNTIYFCEIVVIEWNSLFPPLQISVSSRNTFPSLWLDTSHRWWLLINQDPIDNNRTYNKPGSSWGLSPKIILHLGLLMEHIGVLRYLLYVPSAWIMKV